MKTFLYRCLLLVTWPFLWLLIPLVELWEVRHKIVYSILECYSIWPRAFRKGAPLVGE